MMCPDRELLSAYVDGEVGQPWQGNIEAHLESCATCRQCVAAFGQLSHTLVTDREPDFKPSMARVKQTIDLAPRIIKLNQSPFWKRRLNLPLPLAAAAASLLITIGAFFSFQLATPVPGIVEAEYTPEIAELNTLKDDDLGVIIKFLENKDVSNEVVIQLPEDSNFFISGEPKLIRASDMGR